MDTKKSSQANLDKERTTYFLLGLVVVLSALFVALEWTSEDYLSPDWEGFSQVYIEETIEIRPEQTILETETAPQVKQPVETQPEQERLIREGFEVVEVVTQELETSIDSLLSLSEIAKEEITLPHISEKELKEIVHARAEQMPEFPGGYSHLAAFLYNQIQYPDLAIKQRIQGRVWFSFIVNTDGSIAELKLEQGVYFALDDEAERVLKLMPPWTPGTIAGEPVRVKVYLPVFFKL